MNVFSTLDKPRVPVALTENNYNYETSRSAPYVVKQDDEVKRYALCPACVNPVLVINMHIKETNSDILYAKHAGYSVVGLANHDNEAYLDCPLHNPEKFDSKARRKNATQINEIRQALINQIHLIVVILEKATGISFSDKLIEAMLKDFGANKGYQYKAISLYNLPFGFAYMTEAKDMYGLRVIDDIANDIEKYSDGFCIHSGKYVRRKEGVTGTGLKFYFNNHRFNSSSTGKDTIDLIVAEIENSTRKSKTIYKNTLEFDSEYFYNVYMRRERLRLLAMQYLKD